MSPYRIWVSVTCIAVANATLHAQTLQHYLQGRVMDSLGTGIPYVNVQLNGASKVVTDETGAFRIEVPTKGRFTIDVRRIGYQALHIDFMSVPDSAIHLVLAPIARTLETTRVVAERLTSLVLHGFYDRMKQRSQGTASGYFITPEDIELRQPQRASIMIEDAPSIRIRRVSNFEYAAFGSDGCPANVYLNGHRLDDPRGGSVIFDQNVDAASLAGIEVYTRGTRAPPAYQGLNGSCAVILIWTK